MIRVASRVPLQRRAWARRSPWSWRSRRARHAATVATFLAAALAGPAGARADTGPTLYVDQNNPGCSDTAGGTAQQPYCTIGAAAANTAPGTTVVIASGTYAETVKPPVSGTPGNPVTFTAAPGADVVLTGSPTSAWVFEIAGKSWVDVQGLTFSGAAVYVTKSSNAEIRDNRLTSGGLVVTYSSDVTVSGNRDPGDRISVTESSGVELQYNTVGDGINLSGATQSRVAGNSVSGIRLYGAGGNTLADNVIHATGKGIDIEWSSNNVIANNAIVDSASQLPGAPNYAIEVLGADYNPYRGYVNGGTQVTSNSIVQYARGPAVYVDGSSKTTLADNVVEVSNSAPGPAIRVSPSSVPGTRLDYDVIDANGGRPILWNNWSYESLAKFTAATGQEAHGIQGPAGFADPASGNLSLTPGSPAVDSAFSGTLTAPAGPVSLSPIDAFNGARVDDAATANTGAGQLSYADRGAYEMHNPGFEADTAGWNTNGGSPGIMLSRVDGGHTGTGAALLTNTGTTPGTCSLNDSPNIVHTTTAGTYTATLWVRADQPGATLKLRLREWSGATALGQARTTVTLTTQWQPVTVQYTPVEPGASTLDFSAYVAQTPPGPCFYADDASVFDS